MKFFIKTYGCQMNERDSESVSSLLQCHGFEAADDEASAEIVIVNTCSVREKAEDKAIGKLGILTARKKGTSNEIIGTMGCMAQRLGESILERVPALDFAVGTSRVAQMPHIINHVLSGQGPVIDTGDEESLHELGGHIHSGVSAFVNILFGCNRGCTYCVVPAVRGRERSRTGEDIIKEVRQLVSQGVKEVTLLGQSVMSYGKTNDCWGNSHVSKLGFKEPLPRLLEALGEIDGIERLRFTSGHPSGCTDELISAYSNISQVCEHLHMPVQSGSDGVLTKMKRGYLTDDYREAVEKLRAAKSEMALTTDVIVGFPSESEEDFDMTRSFMDEIGFDNSFIFKYSSRPGTVASGWQDDVSADEKLRRNKLLLEDQDKRGISINEGFVGKSLEVLVEGESLRNADRLAGRSRHNKIVVFEPKEGVSEGDIVNVVIARAMAQTLYGEIE